MLKKKEIYDIKKGHISASTTAVQNIHQFVGWEVQHKKILIHLRSWKKYPSDACKEVLSVIPWTWDPFLGYSQNA